MLEGILNHSEGIIFEKTNEIDLEKRSFIPTVIIATIIGEQEYRFKIKNRKIYDDVEEGQKILVYYAKSNGVYEIKNIKKL